MSERMTGMFDGWERTSTLPLSHLSWSSALSCSEKNVFSGLSSDKINLLFKTYFIPHVVINHPVHDLLSHVRIIEKVMRLVKKPVSSF